MAYSAVNLRDNLYQVPHLDLVAVEVEEAQLADFCRDPIVMDTFSSTLVGMACTQGTRGVLTHIAFAIPTHVLCVKLSRSISSAGKKGTRSKGQSSPLARSREELKKVLLNKKIRKAAFDMHKLALGLYHDHGLMIARAIDLQSTRIGDRQSLDMYVSLLGSETMVKKGAVADAFIGKGMEAGSIQNLALRAWAACKAGLLADANGELRRSPLINATDIPIRDLKLLANFDRVAWRLRRLKPIAVKNDVHTHLGLEKRQLTLRQLRFKTRLRESANQKLRIELEGGSVPTVYGRAVRVQGKTAGIQVNRRISLDAEIKSVITIGREDPTPAELERDHITREALQGRRNFFEPGIVREVYHGGLADRAKRFRPPSEAIYLADRHLNDSQAAAVHRVLSQAHNDQVFLVHGPPGTGKTSVIAASVLKLMGPKKKGRGVWLVAQSNVAVKNIAEKLADVGFLDFKILVSKDFHFEWHEHLYGKIERNVIRSEKFGDKVVVEQLLRGSRVILCTLSTFCHPRFDSAGFALFVPVDTVIVDEASQIEVGDYVPLLGHHGRKINKLAFIGDDKQLAPFGQDDLGNLSSIFEMQHLRRDAMFLDTQYRMPVPIGGFISKHVYSSRLKTSHSITNRRCCILLDISRGQETQPNKSYVNNVEADAIVAVSRKFLKEGKDFRVITPYDAQRNLLEQRLRDAKLEWENKCFNVDSFQGNEADWIVISVVRTEKVGFLNNMRRTNVMLSRCKRGMVICTSRAFAEGKAKDTLLGKLAKAFADRWVSAEDALQGNF